MYWILLRIVKMLLNISFFTQLQQNHLSMSLQSLTAKAASTLHGMKLIHATEMGK